MLSASVSSMMQSNAETVLFKWRGGGVAGHEDESFGSESVWADGGGKERKFLSWGLIRLEVSSWKVSILVWKRRQKNAVQRFDHCWGVLPGPAKLGRDTRWRAPVPRTSAEGLWVLDPSVPKDFRDTDYLNSLPHDGPARGKPLISRHTHPKRTSQSLGSTAALCCRPGRAHPLEGLQNLQCWLPLTL